MPFWKHHNNINNNDYSGVDAVIVLSLIFRGFFVLFLFLALLARS